MKHLTPELHNAKTWKTAKRLLSSFTATMGDFYDAHEEAEKKWPAEYRAWEIECHEQRQKMYGELK